MYALIKQVTTIRSNSSTVEPSQKEVEEEDIEITITSQLECFMSVYNC